MSWKKVFSEKKYTAFTIHIYNKLACAREGLRPSMIVRAPGGFAPHDYTIDNENNTKNRIQIRW